MAEMDRAAYNELKGRLRAGLMEWISEQVAKGGDYRDAGVMAATVLTAESLAMARSLDMMDTYVASVAPLFARASPEQVSVLYRDKPGSLQ